MTTEVGAEASADWAELAEVLLEAGARDVLMPMVETGPLAGWLAAEAGLAAADGPATACAGPKLTVTRDSSGASVEGVLEAVPWARAVGRIVVLTGADVVLLDPAALTLRPGTNLAGEPRDTVVVPPLRLGPEQVGRAPSGTDRQLQLRAALGRALLMAGASGEVLALAVRHAARREQFGRPIARLQAVAQQLAAAGAEVGAVRAATLAAARTADRADFGAEQTIVAVAAAKVRAGMAAAEVARIAHQVHGAAGLVHGQPLATLTARLWAWRDEDGSESHWARVLGELSFRAGPDKIWAMVSQ